MRLLSIVALLTDLSTSGVSTASINIPIDPGEICKREAVETLYPSGEGRSVGVVLSGAVAECLADNWVDRVAWL